MGSTISMIYFFCAKLASHVEGWSNPIKFCFHVHGHSRGPVVCSGQDGLCHIQLRSDAVFRHNRCVSFQVTITRLRYARHCLNTAIQKQNVNRKILMKAMESFVFHQRKTVQFVFQVIKATRSPFLTYMITNVPMNTTVAGSLTLGLIHPKEVATFYGWFCLFQVSIIFFVHWLGSRYAANIHKPVRRLISATLIDSEEKQNLLFKRRNVKTNLYSRKEVTSRIRISCFIQTFHTKKRYGMTYAFYGLITMMSFANVRE